MLVTYRAYTVLELLRVLEVQPYDLIAQSALQDKLPQYINELNEERHFMRAELDELRKRVEELRRQYETAKEQVAAMDELLSDVEGAVESAIDEMPTI
jgi:predicted  nucleic acid-binding Zn-ribbon protein